MARYFKKRRKNQGPNKNEEKVQRAADGRNRLSSGGSLEAHYPGIKRLKISLRFMTPQQQVLDEKVLDLGPADACRFTASCPGRCGTGSFDFSEAVANAINRQQPVMESRAACRDALFAGSSDTCGCQLECRMELEYLPQTEPAGPAGS